MNATAQITDWLNSDKDYNTGVAIYHEHGFSRILKNLFAKGPNAYNTEKLEGEIANILIRLEKDQDKTIRTKSVQKTTTNIPEKQETDLEYLNNRIENRNNRIENRNNSLVPRHTELSVPQYNFEDLPPKLKDDWMIRIKLMKEANRLHFMLDDMESIEERKKSIAIIKENFERINIYWNRLDYWGKTKVILPIEHFTNKKPIVDESDPIALLKKLHNLRSNLSKGRKRLQTLKDNNKIAELHQKVAHWEIEKENIETKLAENG